jgi:hypothetical protein
VSASQAGAIESAFEKVKIAREEAVIECFRIGTHPEYDRHVRWKFSVMEHG